MSGLRTVKEVSQQTGISVRTLHYYDEIGLLKPTACSEAGYRLYDDRALELLQQILLFREFEVPLKEIRDIMKQPGFDREQVLRSQKELLRLKKERLERLMDSIDRILKGEKQMDFTVFDKTEIEDMYNAMVGRMNEEQKVIICEQYGSMAKFREHFLKNAGSEGAQKNFAKVVEWYGDKETVRHAFEDDRGATEMSDSTGVQILQAYQNRLDDIYKRLVEKRAAGLEVSSLEVKQLIGECDFVTKQMYRLPDAQKLLCDMAGLYQTDAKVIEAMDRQYGSGSCDYIGRAIEAFYKK